MTSRLTDKSLGVPLPFYAEVYQDSYSDQPVPRQNFTEYILFCLRSRIRTSLSISQKLIEGGWDIAFRQINTSEYIQMTLGCYRSHHKFSTIPVIGKDYIAEIGDDPEFTTPDWLEPVLDDELDSNFNYAVLLSTSYPLRPDQPEREPPLWWFEEILPVVPWQQIATLALTTKLGFSSELTKYSIKVEGGRVFVNLINSSRQNSGISSVPPGTRILPQIFPPDGTLALAYVGLNNYGDYDDFSRRFLIIQRYAISFILNLYDKGGIPLSPDDSLISRWKLSPYVYITPEETRAVPSIYVPQWQDVRLSAYDGIFNLLYRQSDYSAGTGEHGFVYLDIGTSKKVRYEVANRVAALPSRPILVVYNTIAIIPVRSYSVAREIADLVDRVGADTTSLSVEVKVASDDSTLVGKYYDLQKRSFVVISLYNE